MVLECGELAVQERTDAIHHLLPVTGPSVYIDQEPHGPGEGTVG